MQQHQMVLKETLADGSQEWECPVCGRRFILQWPPNYKRVILEEGDDHAIHSGGTEGIVMGSTEIEPASTTVPADDMLAPGIPVDLDDPTLSPFARWLEENHILP